ncbi:hypothetical protein, partial [Burkholderia pseudomallei]|uniref:hypothetical protein n=1 Tax=Burkholderia pseudomallei TaxID=28450 RepID=UPI001CA5AA54
REPGSAAERVRGGAASASVFDSSSGAVHETCAARERIQARAGGDPVDARLGSGQIGRGGAGEADVRLGG